MGKKMNKPLGKVAVALLLIAGLTLVFTLYQTSINRVVLDTLESLDVDTAQLETSIAPAEVALASGSQASTRQTREVKIDGRATAYDINLSASTTYLGRTWCTDKDHTTISTTFSTSTWQFGGTNAHSSSGCASVWLDIDLGSRVGMLASKSLATLSFSGTLSMGDGLTDNGNGTFGIFSTNDTSKYVQWGSSSGDAHNACKLGSLSGFNSMWVKPEGGSDMEYRTSSRAYSGTLVLKGQYLRIILSSWDSGSGLAWKGWDYVKMSSMSLTLTVSDTTRPYLELGTISNGTFTKTIDVAHNADIYTRSTAFRFGDSSAGIYDGTCAGTSVGGDSVNYNSSISKANQPTGAQTINFVDGGGDVSQGVYTISLEDTAGNRFSATIHIYLPTITIGVDDSSHGTVTTSSISPAVNNDKNGYNAYTLSVTPKAGYAFVGWKWTGSTSGNDKDANIPNQPSTKPVVGKDLFSVNENNKVNKYLGVGSLNGTKWEINATVDYFAGAHSWTAIFKPIGLQANTSLTYNCQAKSCTAVNQITYYTTSSSGTSSTTASPSISYSGNTAASKTYGPTTVAPTYAGTYTVTATVKAGSSVLGTETIETYKIEACKITLTTNAFTRTKVYDGKDTGLDNFPSTTPGSTEAYDIPNATVKGIVDTDVIKFKTFPIKSASENAGTHDIIKNGAEKLELYTNKTNLSADEKANIEASFVIESFSISPSAKITISKKSLGTSNLYGYLNSELTAGMVYGYDGNNSNSTLLTVPANATGKQYDGKADAKSITVLISNSYDSGLCGSDSVTFSFDSATFDSERAGKRKVTIRGITPSSANYSISDQVEVEIDDVYITCIGLELKITETSVTKIYDGTTSATVHVVINNRENVLIKRNNDKVQDNIVVNGVSAAYNSENVASANTVTLSSYSLGDGNADDEARWKCYYVSSVSSVPGTITALALTSSTARFKIGSNQNNVIPSREYNGEEYKPVPTVQAKVGTGFVDVAAAYYTLSYSSDTTNCYVNSTWENNHTMTIEFKGNFSGSISGTYTITPKAITVSVASRDDITYGDNITDDNGESSQYLPALTTFKVIVVGMLSGSINGGVEYKNNEDSSYSSTTGVLPVVGTYTLVANDTLKTRTNNPNYVITFNDDYSLGSFKIVPKAITVSGGSYSMTYGDAYPTLGNPEVTGLVTGGAPLNGGLVYSTQSNRAVGSYKIIDANATLNDPTQNPNYTITFTKGTLTITPRHITLKPVTKTITYGDKLPDPDTLTYSVTSGYLVSFNGTVDSLQGGLKYTTLTYDSDTPYYPTVATYGITRDEYLDSAHNTNYTITFEDGSLVVTRKEITVTVATLKLTYGDVYPDPSSFTLTTNEGSLAAGDTINDIVGHATYKASFVLDEENHVILRDVGTYSGVIIGDDDFQDSAKNPNYDITFAPADVEISKKTVTVTASSHYGIYYGEALPTLTFIVTDGNNNVLNNGSDKSKVTLNNGKVDTFKVSVIRTAAATGSSSTTPTSSTAIGTYSTYISSVETNNKISATLDKNYNTFIKVRGELTIVRRPVIVTPAAASKTYGNSEPASGFTFTVSLAPDTTGTALIGGGSLSGALTRATGENVGEYDILQGTVDNDHNPNYDIIFVSGVKFTITRRNITVKAEYKISYADEIPPAASTFRTVLVSGSLVSGDTLVGGWVYDDSTQSKINNHTPLTVNKTYYLEADSDLKDATKNPNYNITIALATDPATGNTGLRIEPVTAEIFAFGQAYDATRPEDLNVITFGTTINKILFIAKKPNGTVINANFSGALALKDSNNNDITVSSSSLLTVGSYTITLGNLSSSMYKTVLKYDEEGNSPKLTVAKKNVTVKLTSATDGVYMSHIYGEKGNVYRLPITDSEIVGLVTGYGLVQDNEHDISSDDYVGSYVGVNVGKNAGKYPINLGNLNVRNTNYEFSFDNVTYYYQVSPRPVIVTPTSGLSSIYGNAEATLTYTTAFKGGADAAGNSDGIIAGDSAFAGALSRTNYSNKNVSTDSNKYYVTIGSLNDASLANYNANYAVELDSTPVEYKITTRPVTVTAEAKEQIFGESEVVLTVKYSRGNNVGLASTDQKLNGSLTRQSGKTPGEYNIYQGTMDNERNPNYDITFVGAKYVIKARPITLFAENAQKGYGESDPDFEYDKTKVKGGKGTNTIGFVTIEGFEYVPTIIITRAEGEIPGTYAYVYEAQGEYADYYEYTFLATTSFTITRGQSKLAVEGATTVGDALIYSIVYDGTAHSLTPIIVAGPTGADAPEPIVTINNKRVNSFTNVGTYTAVINLDGTPLFAGTQLSLTIIVSPYNLGALNPAVVLDSELSKVYGSEDPDFSATINGVNDETLEVSFTRISGENVIAEGYAFDSITLSNSNYVATIAEGAKFDITPCNVAVTPASFSKVYGTADVELTAIVNGVNDESFEVIFTRSSGENAGNYDLLTVAIIDETSAHFTNYALSFAEGSNEGKFIINQRTATVTVSPISRTFNGTAGSDELTYTLTNVLSGDESKLNGSLKVVDKNNNTVSGLPVKAGVYTIVEDDKFQNDNYLITFNSAAYTISRAAITITSDNVTYEYGQVIAPFTYAVTSGTIFSGFELQGSLGTLESADKGAHLIPQGSLNNENNSDYDITYVAGTCTITVIHVTVKPIALTEQIYGDPFTTITYEIIAGTPIANDIENGMFREGSLSANGTHSGIHDVTIGSLASANGNYEITFQADGAKYVISPRNITVTAKPINVNYGSDAVALSYDVQGLVDGDSLVGSLSCNLGSNANIYPINQGTLTTANNPDYIITYVGADYVIAPRPLTIKILDQASEYVASGEYKVNQLYYRITAGEIVEGDDLGITIIKESGTEMGFYALTGDYTNNNYNIFFVSGHYEIRKFVSKINAETTISFIYNGRPFVLDATCTSGAPVNFSYVVNGETLTENYFVNIGKYVITLSAEETAHHYAPEDVTVEIIIMRDVLSAEVGGIDIRFDNTDGFAPDSAVKMEKVPQNQRELKEVISSSETIVRAYNMEIINNDGVLDSYKNSPSISIKVPSALKDQETVKVVIKDGEDYNVRILNVEEGYVTIHNAANVKTIAFIQETESSNYLIFILLGCGALIVVISVAVFMFRKRA